MDTEKKILLRMSGNALEQPKEVMESPSLEIIKRIKRLLSSLVRLAAG